MPAGTHNPNTHCSPIGQGLLGPHMPPRLLGMQNPSTHCCPVGQARPSPHWLTGGTHKPLTGPLVAQQVPFLHSKVGGQI
jgi:hypothetical protein